MRRYPDVLDWLEIDLIIQSSIASQTALQHFSCEDFRFISAEGDHPSVDIWVFECLFRIPRSQISMRFVIGISLYRNGKVCATKSQFHSVNRGGLFMVRTTQQYWRESFQM